MSKPKYFQIFTDKRKLIELLTDEEAGRLFKAVFAYADGDAQYDFSADRAVKMLYTILTEQIERDFENYSRLCEVNSRNGKKAKKKRPLTTASDRIQEEEKEKEKEEDKEEEKEEYSQAFGGTAAGERSEEFCIEVVDSYNEARGKLPRVKKLTDKRRRLISNADRLLKELGINSFREFFQMAAQSCFLNGDSGKWKGCSFDWLLEENNLVRVAEGVFDDGGEEPLAERSYDLDDIDKINTLDWIS